MWAHEDVCSMGAVTVKGPPDRVEAYVRDLERVAAGHIPDVELAASP